MKSGEDTIVYTTASAGKDTYRSLETRFNSPHHRRCIDGKITGCGKCVGYCSFAEHPGYLTKELRKEHNCVKKECRYYLAKTHDQADSDESNNPFLVLLTIF